MKTAIIITAAIGAGTLSLSFFLSRWKSSISKRVSHTSERGQVSPSTPFNIETIPDEIFTPKYYCLYDHVSKSVSRRKLGDAEPCHLLTLLLQRNMSTFASLPQAMILRMTATSEARESFDPTHIRALAFREGDLVCNAYRVKLRTANKVEFVFELGVSGRLVVSVEQRGNDVVFHNETLMWREKQSKQPLPLERGLAQWMHELTAWWMLDSGVQYLVEMKQ